MNKIRVIKNKKDYEEALELVEALIDSDPIPSSKEEDQLNLLATLIKDYESREIETNLPDPIEAIKFRMEQENLKPADLIPFIGSRSRVSEILSGKRQLTMDMVRSLSSGLGIPAKVLIKKPRTHGLNYSGWGNRLLREIESRGYFGQNSLNDSNKSSLLEEFFSPLRHHGQLLGMLRQSSYRSSPLTDKSALTAWSACVLIKAQKVKTKKKYTEGSLDIDFMRNLAKLSTKEKSPVLAQKELTKIGIVLVIEPHFSKTYLDGAVILSEKERPVIGLTLRHDRLDNFWFTLMHELAHIVLHYKKEINIFYDELEKVKGIDINTEEKEADKLAREALVPESKWAISPARLIPSPVAAQSLADELDINIAIVAGIMRHKHKNYYYLNKITSSAKVRKDFPDVAWLK